MADQRFQKLIQTWLEKAATARRLAAEADKAPDPAGNAHAFLKEARVRIEQAIELEAMLASPGSVQWAREQIHQQLRDVRARLTATQEGEDYDRGVCDACNEAIEQFNTSPGSVSDQGEKRPQIRRLVCKKCGLDIDGTLCSYGCDLDFKSRSERPLAEMEVRIYEFLRAEPLPASPVSPAQLKEK
jgi:hypothetical protein